MSQTKVVKVKADELRVVLDLAFSVLEKLRGSDEYTEEEIEEFAKSYSKVNEQWREAMK